MELEFNVEKDLTETYKQLKKMIATALGEDEFENIANPEARIVADGAWESCSKVSWVSIDYNDVRQFLVDENGNKTTCDKAFLPRWAHSKSVRERI